MEQIISCFRVQAFGEVFTAQKEVKAVCDMLPPEMYQPEKTFLELCREYFKPTKKDVETLTMHIMQGDSVKIMNMMGVVLNGMDTVQ